MKVHALVTLRINTFETGEKNTTFTSFYSYFLAVSTLLHFECVAVRFNFNEVVCQLNKQRLNAFPCKWGKGRFNENERKRE